MIDDRDSILRKDEEKKERKKETVRPQCNFILNCTPIPCSLAYTRDRAIIFIAAYPRVPSRALIDIHRACLGKRRRTRQKSRRKSVINP